MKKRIWVNLAQTLGAILFLIAIWYAIYFLVGNEQLVPAFSTCLKEAGKLLISGGFWNAFFRTLGRALGAFGLAFILAIFFAVLSYLLPAFEKVFAPVVSALRSLPTLAVLLILLVWWGAGFAPVAVAFLSLFPMLYTGILAALIGIDKQLIEISRLQGTPIFRRIYRIYLPLSAPYILREAGGALSFSLKLVVSAEVLAVTAKSLGGMMQEAKVFAEMPTLFALMAIVFVFGLALELGVTYLAEIAERKVK
ncbi:MAG: ABC transporter permease subunit [Clostridia bacterium]|nr:ABC transporter permease subunit [Clostridia bacterium]